MTSPCEVPRSSAIGHRVAPPDIVSGHQVSPVTSINQSSNKSINHSIKLSPCDATVLDRMSRLGIWLDRVYMSGEQWHARTHARTHSLTHSFTHSLTQAFGNVERQQCGIATARLNDGSGERVCTLNAYLVY